MTNREYINSLNSKKLAEFLFNILCSGECGICPMANYCFCDEDKLNGKNPVEFFLDEQISSKIKILKNGSRGGIQKDLYK